MGIEYFFGRDLTRYETAFTGRLVFIENPYKEISYDEIRKIQIFNLKKHAQEFCKRWGLKPESIIRVKTRLQTSWAINMNQYEFLPTHAEGHLIAEALGKTLSHVCTSGYDESEFD